MILGAPQPPGAAARPSRWLPIWRFVLTGATIGLCVGVLEAGLLDNIPRATGLIYPDVRYVIWFIAPLVDLLAGALIGLILGIGRLLFPRPRITAAFAAAGLGLTGAYIAWILDWFRIGAGLLFPRRLDAATAIEFFLVAFGIALAVCLLWAKRVDRYFRAEPRAHLRRWAVFHLVVLAVLSCGIIFYATHRPLASREASTASGAPAGNAHVTPPNQPNIALIVLDTVRADHLTCYGYPRPTTPGICALAAQGVLFQNAIAPSSWTLPSITSIFTGLLPHQTGADWGEPPSATPWTLAKILQSKGYETAGFNANPFYGLGGWRLREGMDFYDDDSTAIRHNLAVTFLGQSVLQTLYDHVIRYNRFDHRNADDLNRDIEMWARGRDPSQPYFLFVNYMDAHRPYLPPARFDHRFGRIPPRLLSLVTSPLRDGRSRRGYTPGERADLIAGYDNSLAYLDSRVERLIEFLKKQPGGGQTVFIITSDHGEGFGEHGTYDHGWNLYREVLHVPLIIAGTGIPAGVRVASAVPDRELFSTVIDLALGLKGAVAAASLRRCWRTPRQPPALPDAVVSELNIFSQGADPAELSLTTSEWQLTLNTDGETGLFDIAKDPDEKSDLASDPAFQPVAARLRASLEAQLAYSLLPWRGIEYLSPLNPPGGNFIREVSEGKLKLPAEGALPIGSAQATFSHSPPSELVQPPPSEQQTLRSLPYH